MKRTPKTWVERTKLDFFKFIEKTTSNLLHTARIEFDSTDAAAGVEGEALSPANMNILDTDLAEVGQGNIINKIEVVDELPIAGQQLLKVKVANDEYTDALQYLLRGRFEQDMLNKTTKIGVYSADGVTEILSPVDYVGTFKKTGDVVFVEKVASTFTEILTNDSGKIVANGVNFSGAANDIVVDVGSFGTGRYKFIPYNFGDTTSVDLKLGSVTTGRRINAFSASSAFTSINLSSDKNIVTTTTDGINLDLLVNATRLYARTFIITNTLVASGITNVDLISDVNKDIRLNSNYSIIGQKFDWILIKVHP